MKRNWYIFNYFYLFFTAFHWDSFLGRNSIQQKKSHVFALRVLPMHMTATHWASRTTTIIGLPAGLTNRRPVRDSNPGAPLARAENIIYYIWMRAWLYYKLVQLQVSPAKLTGKKNRPPVFFSDLGPLAKSTLLVFYFTKSFMSLRTIISLIWSSTLHLS